MSRGRGIYIVSDVSEISLEEVSVVSKYISNPLLINGHKFDLRIYVLVTCIDPLRIYVFKEGLARFATHEYNSSADVKSDKFMHLTNYSINKKSSAFVQSNSLENDDSGFKWSLSAFCNHLELIHTDMELFWSRIYDVIIKSIISSEDIMF
jgi:Tubulin-tyrosine ligase family